MAEEQFELLPAEDLETDNPDFSVRKQREDTRSSIAKIFITGYLAIVILLIAATTLAKLPADVAKDYLLAIGSPLGFVIGYYFKAISE